MASPPLSHSSKAAFGQSSYSWTLLVLGVSWWGHAALCAWHVGGQGGVNVVFSFVSAARQSSSCSWLLQDTTLHFGVV